MEIEKKTWKDKESGCELKNASTNLGKKWHIVLATTPEKGVFGFGICPVDEYMSRKCFTANINRDLEIVYNEPPLIYGGACCDVSFAEGSLKDIVIDEFQIENIEDITKQLLEELK